jgi:hypothetical protein
MRVLSSKKHCQSSAVFEMDQRHPRWKIHFGRESLATYWDECLTARTDILYWADSRLTNGADPVLQGSQINRDTLYPLDDNVVDYVKRRVEKGIWVRGVIPYERNKQLLARQGLLELQNQYVQLKKQGRPNFASLDFCPERIFPCLTKCRLSTTWLSFFRMSTP